MNLSDRFMRHVMLLDDSDNACWIWVGNLWDNGRGKFKRDGKQVQAHRVAYEVIHGEAPPRNVRLRQECANPNCVRHWVLDREWKKLTDDQVDAIRRSSVSGPVLARRYHVSHSYLKHVRCGLARGNVNTAHNGNGRSCASADGLSGRS